MNRKVKRYDPINSDGTCGMCIEDADYGAYVEYADYAALEAELARVKGEYEWVASINTALDESNQSAWAENDRLRAERDAFRDAFRGALQKSAAIASARQEEGKV